MKKSVIWVHTGLNIYGKVYVSIIILILQQIEKTGTSLEASFSP